MEKVTLYRPIENMETKHVEEGVKQVRGSKILLTIFLIVVTFAIGASFYKFFILRDYTIQSQVECDPSVEVCFVYHCDPAVEECSGDPVVDTSYYKLLDRNAKNISLCSPTEEGCVPRVCPEGEVGCAITFCDTSVDEAAECTNPEEYRLQNTGENQGIILDSQEIAPLIGVPDQSESTPLNLAQ